jgi:hypothetical protein
VWALIVVAGYITGFWWAATPGSLWYFRCSDSCRAALARPYPKSGMTDKGSASGYGERRVNAPLLDERSDDKKEQSKRKQTS